VASGSAQPQDHSHHITEEVQQPVQPSQQVQYAQPAVYVKPQPIYAGQQPAVHSGQQLVYAAQQPAQHLPVGQVSVVPINGAYPLPTGPTSTAHSPWCCPVKCTMATSQVCGVLSFFLACATVALTVTLSWGYMLGMGPSCLALFIAMFVAGAPAAASGCCIGCTNLGCHATCCRRPHAIYPGRAFAMRAHQLMVATYSLGTVAWILTMQGWSCPYNGVMCYMPPAFCIVTCSLALSAACCFGKDMRQRQAQAHTNSLGAQRPLHLVEMLVVSRPVTQAQPIQSLHPQQLQAVEVAKPAGSA